MGSFLIEIVPHSDFDPVSAQPLPSTFADTVAVVLSSDDPTETICYTTDGIHTSSCTNGICGAGSTAYASGHPIPITVDNTKLNAVSCKAGATTSPAVLFTYNLKVANITATPLPNDAGTPTTVTLATATSNATIYYTTDGTPATCTSANTGTSVAVAAGTKLSAIGCRANFQSSTAQTFQYWMRSPTILSALLITCAVAAAAACGDDNGTSGNADGRGRICVVVLLVDE